MAKPRDVSDAEFEQEVLKADLPVPVDFWAEWGGPCKIVSPIVEEFEGKVKFVTLDTEENFDTPDRYGIRSLPTLLVFKAGEQVDQIFGARPKAELKRYLDKALA